MKLVCYTFFSLCVIFCPTEFFQHKVFNEATRAHDLLSTFKCSRSGYMRVIYNLNVLHSFSFLTVFSHWIFQLKVFNKAIKGTSEKEQYDISSKGVMNNYLVII